MNNYNATKQIVKAMRRTTLSEVRKHHYWAKHWLEVGQDEHHTRRIYTATAYVLRQQGELR